MDKKYMKCIKCGLEWNVSVKRNPDEPYICPYCEQEIVNMKAKSKKHSHSKSNDRLTKVLLRNKSKFNY